MRRSIMRRRVQHSHAQGSGGVHHARLCIGYDLDTNPRRSAIPSLRVFGYGTVDGASQPFDFTLPESEFAYDVERQILERAPNAEVTPTKVVWSWTASQTFKPSLPLSITVVGKVILHPEIDTAEEIAVELTS